MAVDAVFLVGEHLVLVNSVEVGDGVDGQRHKLPRFAFAVVFDHPTIARRVGDVEVVIPPAGSKHVVAAEQLHRLFRARRAIQHKADGEGGGDSGLAGVLVNRVAVQRQHGDGYALFIEAVKADIRRGQAGQLHFGALIRRVCGNIVQCRRGHRPIAVFRRAVDEHRRGVVFEIVIAPHVHIAVGVRQRERRAAEAGRLDFHRKERQRVLQNGVDHRLIVLDAVVDDVVKAVIVFDLHAVEVVAVVIIRELFDAVHRLYAREVDPDEHEHGGQKHRHDSAEREQRDFQRLFHPVSPFSFEPGTRFVLFLLQRRASARLRWFHLGDCMLDTALLYMNIRPKGKNLRRII